MYFIKKDNTLLTHYYEMRLKNRFELVHKLCTLEWHSETEITNPI